MVSQWFWRANSSGRHVAKGRNAGSKIVEAPGIIFQQLGTYRWGDILSLFQITCSSFRAIRVRVVRGIDEEIVADLLHDALQERLIPFTAKEYPARLEIIARWVADKIVRPVTWVFKMVVHPLYMSWHPADPSLKESKL